MRNMFMEERDGCEGYGGGHKKIKKNKTFVYNDVCYFLEMVTDLVLTT